MEEEWVVKRCQLRQMWLEHPEWSRQKMAEAVGCSKSWVKKWLHLIRSVPLEDQQVMYGLSRTPKHPPPDFSPLSSTKSLRSVTIRPDCSAAPRSADHPVLPAPGSNIQGERRKTA